MKIKISWKDLSKIYLQSKGLSPLWAAWQWVCTYFSVWKSRPQSLQSKGFLWTAWICILKSFSVWKSRPESLQPKGFPQLSTAWICTYVVSRLFFHENFNSWFPDLHPEILNNSSIHLSSSYKRKSNQKSKSDQKSKSQRLKLIRKTW